MMSLKDNNDKKDDETTTSGALNTEEILSLLSKTSQDFKKEADISENISYLFKKKSLKDIAEASRVSDQHFLKVFAYFYHPSKSMFQK